MKRILLWAVCFFASERSLLATDLVLSDGRIFNEWHFRSQTASAIFITHKGGATKIEKKLLPAELKIKYPMDVVAVDAEARALVEADAAGRARIAQVAADRKKEYDDRVARAAVQQRSQGNNPIAQPPRAPETGTRGVGMPAPVTKKNEAAEIQATLGQVQARTAEQVKSFFHKNPVATGAGAEFVRNVEVAIERTASVDGWPGRYRTTGEATISMYDRIGNDGWGKATEYRRSFECITEWDSANGTKVVALTTR